MAKNIDSFQNIVLLCTGKDCEKRGAKAVGRACRKLARTMNAKRSTHFLRTRCTGMCKQAPIMSVQPANVWLTRATEKSACQLLRAHLKAAS